MQISDFVAGSQELIDCSWKGMTWDRHCCGLMKFGPHKYGTFYDRILTPLRDENIKLVEIGISGGWSLLLWDQYFTHPETQIVGVDPLFSKPMATSGRTGEIEKAQCRIEMYADIRKKYSSRVLGLLVDAYTNWLVEYFDDESLDVVLDDGSHRPAHKLFVVENYWSKVKPGGWLIIEDYHRSNDEKVLNAVLNTQDVKETIIYQGAAEGRVFHANIEEGLLCIRKQS